MNYINLNKKSIIDKKKHIMKYAIKISCNYKKIVLMEP